MTDTPDANDPSDPAVAGAASPLTKLSRAQVFARDPEEMTQAELDFVVEELRKITARNRKARNDDALVTETAAKIKKANAVTRKKKAGTVAADILETAL